MDHVRGFIYRYRWGWVGSWMRSRKRQADRDILFPIIANAALQKMPLMEKDIFDRAYGTAVATHCWLDSAWRFRDEWKHEPEAEIFERWYPAIRKVVTNG